MLAQFLDRPADQRAAVIGAHRDQLHEAVGEIEHLQGGGVVDELEDVIGNDLFRADDDIDRQHVLAEYLRVRQVVGGADAGDLGGRVEQRVGNGTGDDVGFVAVGDGQDQVGVLTAGLAQHVRVAGGAGHGAQVEAVLQVGQFLRVGVDDGDGVVFAHQVFGHRRADLTRAENDDFHDGSLDEPGAGVRLFFHVARVDAELFELAVQVRAFHLDQLGDFGDVAAGAGQVIFQDRRARNPRARA